MALSNVRKDQPPRRRYSFIIAVAVAFALLGSDAGANLGSILDGTNLTPGDMERASAAAETLYTQAGVKQGDTVSWENPETGARGVVVVTGVDPTRSCVSFRHQAEPADFPVRKFDMKRCKNSENVWVLVPE